MQKKMRVSEITNKSRFAMERWFYKLYISGMLFHPDDRPDDFVERSSGSPIFWPDECLSLNRSLDILFQHHGDVVYEVGLKYFHKAINLVPDHSAT